MCTFEGFDLLNFKVIRCIANNNYYNLKALFNKKKCPCISQCSTRTSSDDNE